MQYVMKILQTLISKESFLLHGGLIIGGMLAINFVWYAGAMTWCTQVVRQFYQFVVGG